MIKIVEDVTDKYYNMLESFRADNTLEVLEVKDDIYPYDFSVFDKRRELIKNDNEKLMKDIELLEELEFNLRHNFYKIVKIDREQLDDNEYSDI